MPECMNCFDQLIDVNGILIHSATYHELCEPGNSLYSTIGERDYDDDTPST